MSDRTVLVAGASGHLGSAIIKELKARGGYRVRALTRKPERVAHLPADETVIGDLRTPASLEVACTGADAVIGASGASLKLSVRIGSPTYRAVDYEGNLNLLAAAQAADIERFVKKPDVDDEDEAPGHPLRAVERTQGDASGESAIGEGQHAARSRRVRPATGPDLSLASSDRVAPLARPLRVAHWPDAAGRRRQRAAPIGPA